MSNTANENLVREFVAAWSRLNVEELLDYFTEDGTYHNMPIMPVASRGNLRAFITAFTKDWTDTEWEIINLASSGNTVFVERIDRTRLGERSVDLPCCGVFEIENGKIKVWRDYFDLATYTKGAAG